MIDMKVIAVRRVVRQGGSLAVVLPMKFCKREKIMRGDFFVMMDRGTRITGTSLKQYEFDQSLKTVLKKKEGEK